MPAELTDVGEGDVDRIEELSKHQAWQLKEEAFEFLYKIVIRFCDPEQEDGPHVELSNHAIKTFTPVALNLSRQIMESKQFMTDKVLVNAIKMTTHAFRFKFLQPLVIETGQSLLFDSSLRLLRLSAKDVYNYEADDVGFI